MRHAFKFEIYTLNSDELNRVVIDLICCNLITHTKNKIIYGFTIRYIYKELTNLCCNLGVHCVILVSSDRFLLFFLPVPFLKERKTEDPFLVKDD